jgi:hypothetical protein
MLARVCVCVCVCRGHVCVCVCVCVCLCVTRLLKKVPGGRVERKDRWLLHRMYLHTSNARKACKSVYLLYQYKSTDTALVPHVSRTQVMHVSLLHRICVHTQTRALSLSLSLFLTYTDSLSLSLSPAPPHVSTYK